MKELESKSYIQAEVFVDYGGGLEIKIDSFEGKSLDKLREYVLWYKMPTYSCTSRFFGEYQLRWRKVYPKTREVDPYYYVIKGLDFYKKNPKNKKIKGNM